MQSAPAVLAQTSSTGTTALLVLLLLVALAVFAAWAYRTRLPGRRVGSAGPDALPHTPSTLQDATPLDAHPEAESRLPLPGIPGSPSDADPASGPHRAVEPAPSAETSTPRDCPEGTGAPWLGQAHGTGEPPPPTSAPVPARLGGSTRLTRASERRTRYPLVFAHGLLGFDAIEIVGRRHEYFRGVPSLLQRSGTEVYLLRVAPTASIEARARQLAEQIRRLPVDRVNIVAHSMGGLDARYAISGLGLSDVVASLTTIGTPHYGTPLADLSIPLLGRMSALPAIEDLTTIRMIDFNRRVADAPGVVYRCFVCSVKGGIGQLPKLLVPGYLFLSWRAGDNDGLVPAESQRWGDVMGHVDANHWGQIGWSRGFDTTAFYTRLVDGLCEQGL